MYLPIEFQDAALRSLYYMAAGKGLICMWDVHYCFSFIILGHKNKRGRPKASLDSFWHFRDLWTPFGTTESKAISLSLAVVLNNFLPLLSLSYKCHT